MTDFYSIRSVSADNAAKYHAVIYVDRSEAEAVAADWRKRTNERCAIITISAPRASAAFDWVANRARRSR